MLGLTKLGAATGKIVFPLVLGVVAGIGLQQKVFDKKITFPEPKPCPACICPEAVSVQPFDVEKIKNLRNFTYAPQFTGSVSVAGVDSMSIRRYIHESVTGTMEKVLSEEKRKRK